LGLGPIGVALITPGHGGFKKGWKKREGVLVEERDWRLEIGDRWGRKGERKKEKQEGRAFIVRF
jgi:hypothetical protein